ncbi:MAG: SPOR domain-containing protein [Treponema sp.]|nr:SPOR domain-containing protein [Treponema sp.]
MKKVFLAFFVAVFCVFLIGASKPSLDGRAIVADSGELPSGLFAKSPGYLPGDIVVVTNPQTNISIEVMVFGSFDATEGIAIVLSPEAAKELYISKGSNVIVQVTKKSDAYSEKTILSKTLESYVPETTPEMDEMLSEKELEELIEENNIEDSLEEEVEIQEEDILFVEDVEIVEDELIAEVIPEESEIIAEPVEEELVAEVIPKETEIVAEPVEEELVAEVIPEESEIVAEPVEEELVAEVIPEESEIVAEPVEEELVVEVIPEESEIVAESVEDELVAEEDLSKIPQTLPDWSEERPIPDFGFSDENTDLETSEEFIAEMDRGIEVEPVVETTEDAEIITTEEVALVPTEPKPPVFTIIPVPVEEEILEDDSILEEPEVVFVEEVDEVEDKQENSESEEVLVFLDAKMILNNEDDLEIEEVVYSAVKPVNSLPVDKYYVQIATYSKYENMEAIVKKYGKNYPIVVYQPTGRSDYQVMIGGLNKDEYAIVLERFRKAGYKDAFLRSTF